MQGGGIFLLRRVKGKRKNFGGFWLVSPEAAKPPTGRFCWVVHDGSLLGPFSLTKRAPKEILFARISFSFQKAPDDTGISSAAALDQQALPAGHPPPFEKGGRKLFLYLKVLASPTFLVMPRLSQYSKIATANLREAPIRSRISARVICPFLATCSLAISSALL